ncbi:hypothetical protein [Streptomyces sp. GD-15H]|uniref:hypothetical protein n=1 Tax=Streptomyces sp. GD-15H TaxID=3129112 RepID=UPI003873710C
MPEWTWEYGGYDPAAERLRESLCARGAVPESRAGVVRCPGTCAAGRCHRLESRVAGRQVVNEGLVNLPDRLCLRFRCRPADGPWGPWFSPDTCALLEHRHTLDLRRADPHVRLSGRRGRAECSEESPIRVVLAGRAVTVAPGETCTLVSPPGCSRHASSSRRDPTQPKGRAPPWSVTCTRSPRAAGTWPTCSAARAPTWPR